MFSGRIPDLRLFELQNSVNVRIILVGTTHPGNIGATARAMKNMGLSDLMLVNPKYFPHEDATVRASGAEDILQSARVVAGLEEALGDCTYVAGASAVDPKKFRSIERFWNRYFLACGADFSLHRYGHSLLEFEKET